MIHFAYPTAKKNEFTGCGRFRVSDREIPGYTPATPSIANRSEVNTAAILLAPELKENGRVVYERKDSESLIYMGDSMNLAYMLALISRSRTLKIPPEYHADIWCTGAINIKDNRHPFLQAVQPFVFDAKLEGFLSDDNPDRLFIVPAANIENHHQALFQQNGVNILTLNRSSKKDLPKILQQKTVLKVWENDLHLLRDFLFQKPLSVRRTFAKSAFVLLGILLLAGLWFFLQKSGEDAPKMPLAETIIECLENGEFTRAIALVEKAPRHDSEVMRIKEMIMKPLPLEPLFQYVITGTCPPSEYPMDYPKLENLILGDNDYYRFIISGTPENTDLYLYIFQMDSEKKFQRLFPNPIWSSKNNPLHPSDFPFHIPPPVKGKSWMRMDAAKGGEETFYLIISPWRAIDNEHLYGEIYKATGNEERDKQIQRLIGQLRLREHAWLPSVMYRKLTFRHEAVGNNITDD